MQTIDKFDIRTLEAGIALQGNEVKSIRLGNVNLKDSWCSIENGELLVKGLHISSYEKDGLFRTDPMRTRKLLMHKQEINRLFGKVKQDGLTLIPISLYFKDSCVKVQVGCAKEKNCMISGKPLWNEMHNVKFDVLSRFRINEHWGRNGFDGDYEV